MLGKAVVLCMLCNTFLRRCLFVWVQVFIVLSCIGDVWGKSSANDDKARLTVEMRTNSRSLFEQITDKALAGLYVDSSKMLSVVSAVQSSILSTEVAKDVALVGRETMHAGELRFTIPDLCTVLCNRLHATLNVDNRLRRVHRRAVPEWLPAAPLLLALSVQEPVYPRSLLPLTTGIADQRHETVRIRAADLIPKPIVVSKHLAAAPLLPVGVSLDKIMVAQVAGAAWKKSATGPVDTVVKNFSTVDKTVRICWRGLLEIIGVSKAQDPPFLVLQPRLGSFIPLLNRALHGKPIAEQQQIRPQLSVNQEKSDIGLTKRQFVLLLISSGVILLVILLMYLRLRCKISDYKRAEQKLMAQLEFQQSMIEAMPYPFVAKDNENRYIVVNRAFEETLGMRRDSVLGYTTLETKVWGTQSVVLHQMVGVSLDDGNFRCVELEFINYAGERRDGLFCISRCTLPNGRQAGAIATMIDVTERRRIEVRARETERRLSDLTGSLPVMIFQLQHDGPMQYSLAYITGGLRRWFGEQKSRYLDDLFAYIDDMDRRRVHAELEHSAYTGEPLQTEFRLLADGEEAWVRAEFIPRFDTHGSAVWNSYWIDVSSEHARIDELARGRDVAEAALKIKNDFLAMMSHEIRTPMNGIIGLVEILERTRLNHEQKQMLSMVHRSAEALLRILDDMLDYLKIEARYLTIEAEPLDLRELVDHAVGLLAGRAHEKGLTVRIGIEPEVAAIALGDGVRIRQILLNLLSNAIKFTSSGRVEVRVSALPFSEHAQLIRLNVIDTGIGIEADAQERLFDPFVQAESTTAHHFGGTGLGLAICQQLIKLMEGTLTLSSTVGIGTTMTVQFVMPVEQSCYPASCISGQRGIVICSDVVLAQALIGFGRALGLELEHIAPEAIGDLAEAVLASTNCVIAEHGIDLSVAAIPSGRVIWLTEEPQFAEALSSGERLQMSANPISWQEFREVCESIFSDKSTRVLYDPEPVYMGVGAREQAIKLGRFVLVAEDHPVNQELIRHQLALLGFACDVVDNGAAALIALEHTTYHYLITDCHMPNLSGYELAQRVREREKNQGGAHLPILGVTANNASEEQYRCLEAGMDACLVKPTRLATLREHLVGWRDGAAVHSSADTRDERAYSLNSSAVESDWQSEIDDFADMWTYWNEDETAKSSLLNTFITALWADLREFENLLGRPDEQSFIKWHHRVLGAAVVLRYQPLLDMLEGFRCEIEGASTDELYASGRLLSDRCRVVLERMEQHAAQLEQAADQ